MSTALRRVIPRRLLVALACLLGLLGVLGLTAQSASASPGQVVKVPVAEAVFTCNDGTTFTATSGDAVAVFHESTDPQGGVHVTGTIAPSNVTLSRSSDNLTYRLAGASWFGGNITAGGTQVFSDTEHFRLLAPSGGAAGSVSIVSHATVLPDGTVVIEFERNTGTCTPPED
jgi:hypothetical protein